MAITGSGNLACLTDGVLIDGARRIGGRPIGGIRRQLGVLAGSVLPPGMLLGFIRDELIAGVGSVLVFLPQILFLFLFILGRPS